MTLISKDNVLFSSIVKEFGLSDSIVEKSEELENLVKNIINARIDLSKLFKMKEFNFEYLEMNKKELIENININKSKISSNDENKIELRDKIKVNKSNIKVIKLYIKELENNLNKEKQQGRILHEALEIFLSRGKLKFIKMLIVKKYKKAYLNYPNELCIKTKIKQCNERKDKIRKEEHEFNNDISRFNRKISNYKSALSLISKSTISMLKYNDLYTIKIESVMNYKELEDNLRIEAYKY